MQPENMPQGLGNAGTYIKKALKFYDINNEHITPVIFIIMLIAGFSGAFLPESMNSFDKVYIIYNIIAVIIVYTASSTYLYAYIRDLKGESYTAGSCIYNVLKLLPKLIAASVILALLTALGLILLIVPGIIIYLLFIFNTCFILDKGTSILPAFKFSSNVTAGRKTQIFTILLLFNIILFVPLFIIITIALSSEKPLVFSFVTSFVSAVANLMQQRIIALMYRDIVYGIGYKKITGGNEANNG
jgi:hypothetical protein